MLTFNIFYINFWAHRSFTIKFTYFMYLFLKLRNGLVEKVRLAQDRHGSGFCGEESDLALGGDKDALPRTDSPHSRTSIPTGCCRGQQTSPKMQGQGGRIFPGQGGLMEIKCPVIPKAWHHP